jgi:YegS/Rv2252/BmrU family lipid kinase
MKPASASRRTSPSRNGHFESFGAIASRIGRDGVEQSGGRIKFSSTRRAAAATQFRVRRCVIFNPTARGEKARRLRRHLDEISREADLKETCGVGDARRIAREAAGDGYDVVVAAGGDGTLNEAVNGIAEAPGGLERVRLGVLPLGTVNVFARELAIPRSLDAAWKTILSGTETVIDLPSMEYSSTRGRSARYFAQLAGAGLDARAIELVHWPLKKMMGPLAYVFAGFRALMGRQTLMTADTGDRKVKGELVLVGPGRLYGGAFRVFPEADLRDGLLEICVFPRVNWLKLARCGPGLLLSGGLPPGATLNFRAGSFTLTCDVPAPVEADGEWVGHLPAKFSVRPRALRVIVPRE